MKQCKWVSGSALLCLFSCGDPADVKVTNGVQEEARAVEHGSSQGHGHGHGRGHGHGNRGGTGGAGTGGTGAGGASTGGTSTGGASTGGIAGTGGGGGAIADLVGTLDGRLMQFPCADTPVTDDCSGLGYVVDGVVTACAAGRSDMVLDHPIAGTPGSRYLVTMHFYGIMESKNLGPNVTREAAPARPNLDGGPPLSWATAPAGTNYPISDYSAYEIHVHNEAGQEIAQYYLNGDVAEGHWTIRIDFEKSIEVVGGGFVRLRRIDRNCRLIKNCGTTFGYPCDMKARTLDLSAAEPPPPPPGSFDSGGFNQPGLNHDANNGGQWWMIDVTAVSAL